MKVIVLHEYGAPEHYLGLEYYINAREEKVQYVNFTFYKLFLKAIMKKNYGKAFRVLHDLLFVFVSFLFPSRLKSKVLIIGCAPMDWHILVLLRLSREAKVIYHSSWGSWDGSTYPKRSPIFKRYIEKKWLFFLQSRVKQFALVTPQVQWQLINYKEIEKAKCHMVYHSFDTSIFYPVKSPEKFTKHCIFVGRLVEEKGIQVIFELAKHLPEYRFSIVGSGFLAKEVANQCNGLHNCHYVGFIEDRYKLAELYRTADFILQPSLRTESWEELFGIALIEAMACGVVPFASEHLGPSTILNETPLVDHLFPESDFIDQTLLALQRFSVHPEALFQKKLAAICLAQKYSRESIAIKWKEVLEKV